MEIGLSHAHVHAVRWEAQQKASSLLYIFQMTETNISVTLVIFHSRINLVAFTKYFRGRKQQNESME